MNAPLSTTPLPQWKQHLPNALSLARLGLAAVVVAILSLTGPRGHSNLVASAADPARAAVHSDPSPDVWLLAATAVFLLAAATDMLDGLLARRWKVVSRFGRIVDPCSDKVLVIGTLVALAGPAFSWFEPGARSEAARIQLTCVTPLVVWIVLLRELLVTSIRGVLEAEGVDFSADTLGKAKMIVQSFTIPLIMVVVAVTPMHTPGWGRTTLLVAVILMVALTVVSGFGSIRRAKIGLAGEKFRRPRDAIVQ